MQYTTIDNATTPIRLAGQGDPDCLGRLSVCEDRLTVCQGRHQTPTYKNTANL